MKTFIKFVQNKYFIIALLVVVALYGEFKIVDTYKPQSIIKTFKLEFQPPLTSRDKGQATLPTFQVRAQTVDLTGKKNTSAKVEVPVSTNPRDIILAQKHGIHLVRVWQLETESSKTDGCRSGGKFGGFGVKSDGVVVCYATFQEAASRASYWFDKLYEGHTLDQTLCKWSGSGYVDNCEYSMNFYKVPLN